MRGKAFLLTMVILVVTTLISMGAYQRYNRSVFNVEYDRYMLNYVVTPDTTGAWTDVTLPCRLYHGVGIFKDSISAVSAACSVNFCYETGYDTLGTHIFQIGKIDSLKLPTYAQLDKFKIWFAATDTGTIKLKGYVSGPQQ